MSNRCRIDAKSTFEEADSRVGLGGLCLISASQCERGWCEMGLSEQGYGSRLWFMHDADLGHAFLFLDMLAEYTLL